ncbi:MAG: NUDIX hydrolase [Halofilum sp. (in: g-proteobacteria)]|nr:NUDIX hydrolase [Halofilum sp. (in: g-proteobacteria)]
MTVAAVIERDARFLMVEEHADGRRVYNQPAGHLEPDEGLVDAVVREVLEETRTHFRPRGVIGIYRWVHPASGETHVRIAFSGTTEGTEPGRALDTPIIAPRWCSYDELRAAPDALRSPLVLGCIDDYLGGRHYPLALLRELA